MINKYFGTFTYEFLVLITKLLNNIYLQITFIQNMFYWKLTILWIQCTSTIEKIDN